MKDCFPAEVKLPADVRQGWDLLTIREVVPAAKVIRPMQDGGCTVLDPA